MKTEWRKNFIRIHLRAPDFLMESGLLPKNQTQSCSQQMQDDFHLYRSDRLSKWRQLALDIPDHPEILAAALHNIERWLARGRLHPAPLLEWRQRIHTATSNKAEMQRFLEFIASDDFDSEPLKSCSPFIPAPVAL